MRDEDERSAEVARLIAFSDGVFAFAITLLVITIPYPTLSSSIGLGPFLHQLFALKYAFFSYAVSFAIIGFYWFSHREYSATSAGLTPGCS